MDRIGVNRRRRVSHLKTVSIAALLPAVLLLSSAESYAFDPGKQEARQYRNRKKSATKTESKSKDKKIQQPIIRGRLRANEEAREKALKAHANVRGATPSRDDGKWYSLGCGTSGDGTVPWGNVAAIPRIRLWSNNAPLGAAVEFTVDGDNSGDKAFAFPFRWKTYTFHAAVLGRPGAKVYYSWGTMPGSTAYVCAQGKGFG